MFDKTLTKYAIILRKYRAEDNVLSLKENVEFIKEELNSEEKFFEKAVVTERFVKKYKKHLIAGVSVVVVAALLNVVYTVKEQNRIEAANSALLALEKNPKDATAKTTLQTKSPKLYELWSFAQAVGNKEMKKLQELESKKLAIVSDVARYEVAQNKKDVAELKEYALEQNSIYKDLALVQSAIVYLDKNEIAKAREELSQVSAKSPLANVASVLKHYGVQ